MWQQRNWTSDRLWDRDLCSMICLYCCKHSYGVEGGIYLVSSDARRNTRYHTTCRHSWTSKGTNATPLACEQLISTTLKIEFPNVPNAISNRKHKDIFQNLNLLRWKRPLVGTRIRAGSEHLLTWPHGPVLSSVHLLRGPLITWPHGPLLNGVYLLRPLMIRPHKPHSTVLTFSGDLLWLQGPPLNVCLLRRPLLHGHGFTGPHSTVSSLSRDPC